MLGKIVRKLEKGLSFLEDWILFSSVMVALVSLFANVVLRYGFNYSLAWSEELVREVIILTTFIGCSVAIKNGTMIKIDAVIQLVPKLKKPFGYFSNLMVLIFAGMLVYYGWKMAELQVMTNQKTIILRIPLVYMYSILPVTGVMMIFRTCLVLWDDIREQFLNPTT